MLNFSPPQIPVSCFFYFITRLWFSTTNTKNARTCFFSVRTFSLIQITALIGYLGGDLPRPKGLDQVAAQVRTLVNGMAAHPGKFNIDGFGGAAIGGYQHFPVCFFQIADVVNGRFQR
ncbi:MAG: hypothetical protein KIG43_02480 [Eubacteriales bacterium]|nr:hypothetical protein [Eubacteriales bacterium]